MAYNMPRPASNAAAAQNGDAKLLVNDFRTAQELRIVLKNTTSADIGPFLIIPSTVPAQTGYKSQQNKETDVVASGIGTGTYEELVQYITNAGLVIDEIRTQASGENGADNYEGKLMVGEILPNGRTEVEDIELADNRTEVGNGFNTVLSVKRPMAVTPAFFMAISTLKANTSLVLRLKVSRAQRGIWAVANNE